jgi:hypothetical protein
MRSELVLSKTIHFAKIFSQNGYTVTSLGKIASSLLDAMELDYLEICAKRGIDDPEIMLSETKQKNLARGSSTEQRSQTG